MRIVRSSTLEQVMPFTKRARRRLFLLASIGLVGVVVVFAAWNLQQWRKNSMASTARAEGLAAAEVGDWPEAMARLRLAVSRDKEDGEAVLALAEARSRIPSENNGHFSTAGSYFDRASEIFAAENDETGLRLALLGRARMEVANRSILRLQETSRQLLELDPDEEIALRYLLEMQRLRGNYLPRSSGGSLPPEDYWKLSVRSEWGSDEAWLEALRAAEDESALRWSLELLRIGPDDYTRRDELLGTLRDGGSVDLQLLAFGVVRESPLDVARQWVDAAGSETDDARPWLTLAIELMREARIDEAREIAEAADAIGYANGDVTLLGLAVWENLGRNLASEDQEGRIDPRRRAVELLALCEDQAREDPAVAIKLAVRLWNMGRSSAAYRLIEFADEAAEPIEPPLMPLPALLAAIDGRSDLAERIERIAVVQKAPDTSVELRDQLGILRSLLEMVDGDATDEEIASAAATASTSYSSNALVQILIGDLLSAGQFPDAALQCYQRAAEVTGHRSVPLASRLVRGYLDQEMLVEAFRAALRFSEVTQSSESITRLCETWLALDAQGLVASEIEPRFDQWESPFELISAVVEVLDDGEGSVLGLMPLYIDAAARAGAIEEAQAGVDRMLEGDARASLLIATLRLSGRHDLGRTAEILAALDSAPDADAFADQIAVTRATVMRARGDLDGAREVIERHFEKRDDDDARRLFGLAQLDAAMAEGESGLPAIEWLLANVGEIGEATLLRMQSISLDEGEREISAGIIERLFGERSNRESPAAALALARHTTRFEIEDPESVRRAVALADRVVADGSAGAELELLLAQMMIEGGIGDQGDAIELLRGSVVRRPGRFDNALALVDALQMAGRFDEADEVLDELWSRRDAAPPSVRRMIPVLRTSQGDPSEIAKARCELAEMTGDPIDRLDCVRSRYRVGEMAEADAELDALLLLPDRPSAVDIEGAARLVRRGDPEAAIALLRGSEVFPSGESRLIALGSLLLRLDRIGELATLLEENATLVMDSATLQILVANRHLLGEDRDEQAASAALERAERLGADDEGVLRRVATLRLQDPGLRSTAREAIERIDGLGDSERALMLLALDAFPEGSERLADGLGIEEADRLITRSQELIDRYPNIRPAWALGVQIVGGLFDASTTAARTLDVSREEEIVAAHRRSNRIAEQLVDLLEAASSRFPGDAGFLARLSEIETINGDLEAAVVAARAARERSGPRPPLGASLPLARAQALSGDFRSAITTLDPYLEEIRTGPANRRGSWSLLVTSLLQEGRIDEAWEFFTLHPGADARPGRIRGWLDFLASAPPEVVIAGVSRLGDLSLPEKEKVAGTLLSVHSKTGSPAMEAALQRLFEEMRAESSDPVMALALRLMESGLTEKPDPAGTLVSLDDILDSMPPEVLSRVGSMSPDDLPKAGPMVTIAVLTMNNYAAIAAKAILEGDLDPRVTSGALERAIEFSEIVGRVMAASPEVSDTRALVALAAGRVDDALRFAGESTRVVPTSPSFRLTLAKAFLAAGNPAMARLQAEDALELAAGAFPRDLALQGRIESFLDVL